MDKLEDGFDVQVYLILGFDDLILKSYSKWLEDKNHYLIILDTEDIALKNKVLSSSNIIIKKIKNLFDITKVLSEIAWQFIFLNIKLVALKEFKAKNQTLTEQIIEKWREIEIGVHLSASSFVDYQIPDLISAMKNIQFNLNFSEFNNLKNYFYKIPAIICGAGPSLERSLEAFKDKALIFSGGSALNALDINPHFIGLIDRETPLEFFQKSFSDSVLFFLLKAPCEILKKKFRKKFLCAPKEHHLFFKWIFQNSNLDIEPINTGWSTVTFLTSLALHLGCDPIIFNGVDLGFKNKKIYADNVPKSSYEKKQGQHFIKAYNEVKDEIRTQSDWYMSALFLREITANNVNTTFYNLSKEGLFLGDQVKSFRLDEIKNWPSFNILDKLASLETRKSLKIKDDLINEILNLIDCELQINQKKLEELKKVYKNEPISTKEKTKSWCEENVLTILWDIFKFTFLRNEAKDETYSLKEKIHQILFFNDVLEQHKNYLKKHLNA